MSRSARPEVRQTAFRWIVTLGVGATAALAYFNHFVRQYVTTPLDKAVLAIYLIGLFSALGYFLLFRSALPRVRAFPRHVQIGWVAIALSVATLLIIMFPITVPAESTIHQLEITPTGQKNSAAQSAEVWVIGLSRNDGSPIALSEFSSGDGWRMRDGKLFSDRTAATQWKGLLNDNAQLHLLAHPWSGIAQIRWDGQAQLVDLYADPAIEKVIVLPDHPVFPQNRGLQLRQILLSSADIISIGLLAFVISVWMTTRPMRARRTRTSY